MIDLGCRERVDLIIVVPGNLLPEPSRRTSVVSMKEVASAIYSIKRHREVPIIAVGAAPEDEMTLFEAGVDALLRPPLDSEVLKAEVRRVLRLAAEERVPEVSRWSLGGLFRGVQRLKSA
jgi:DNA-binding response OmpR family regulator